MLAGFNGYKHELNGQDGFDEFSDNEAHAIVNGVNDEEARNEEDEDTEEDEDFSGAANDEAEVSQSEQEDVEIGAEEITAEIEEVGPGEVPVHATVSIALKKLILKLNSQIQN